MIRSVLVLLAVCSTLVACGPSGPDLEKDRVLVLVVDGLRPDYVTDEYMPRLDRLAQSGVRGLAHHAVVPTVTRVNGPSIFTGRYPSGHGLLGNVVFLPEVDSSRVLDMSSRSDLLSIDEATGGRLLTTPSLGEILDDAGLTYFAASSGSTGSATFLNHRGAGYGLVHHDFTFPDSLQAIVDELLGPPGPPAESGTSIGWVDRAIDAVLRIGLDRADADVLAAWLTEPDGTAHATGIGSPETMVALAEVDNAIGRLLDGLQERGVLARTNILIVSDHGFSTHTGTQSLSALLVDAGLKASPGSMDVVIAGGAIHVREGGPERVAAIVRALQAAPWVGPIFTRGEPGADAGAYPGTASFERVGWNHARSADILVTPGWSDAENDFGFRGETYSTGSAGHGSASPWDIHATLIASGPAFKRFESSPMHTGNIDITPTVLALMDVPLPPDLDGRVLEELMVGGPAASEIALEAGVEQVSADFGGGTYLLSTYRTVVGGETFYFDGFDVAR